MITGFCFLSADAPPHGLGLEHDGFPQGCPTGNDPLRACRSMVENGIVLYCVGCEPNILQYKDFYMGLAFMTGGQYVPLSRAQALSQVRVCCKPFSLYMYNVCNKSQCFLYCIMVGFDHTVGLKSCLIAKFT